MRSKLFVPASRPELFSKAMASDADAISFDLEDSVIESMKGQARQHLVDYIKSLSPHEKILIVRINDMDSEFYQEDLEALSELPIDIVNLPKVEAPSQIKSLETDLKNIRKNRTMSILANIESPKGLRQATSIAKASHLVIGLQLGFADLLEPLGISRKENSVIQQIQLNVRLAAGEAGVSAYDAAFPNIKDSNGFLAEAEQAKALGFSGKSCIHPNQIILSNRAFFPTKEEIEWARKVFISYEDADKKGLGAYALEGQMIDRPFIKRAKEILTQANIL